MSQQAHHRFEATLRFVGDAVIPDEISQYLGVNPTQAHTKGDAVPKHPSRRRPTGYWGLESSLSQDAGLHEHVEQLLAVLEQSDPGLQCLFANGVRPSIYCGVFMSAECVAPIAVLPADILARVGASGASVEIHAYSDGDDDQDP